MSGWSSSFAGLKSFADQVSNNVASSLQDAAKGLEEASKGIQTASQGIKQVVDEAKTKSYILQEAAKVFDLDSMKLNGEESNETVVNSGENAAMVALGIHQLTDRLLGMGFPVSKNGKYTEDDIAAVLNAKYGNNYMVWNLAEKEYNTTAFQGQVMEYKFPGYPAPPLGMLLKICISIESWLNSDPKNVAVIHCLTGKGRTMVVTAAFLAWIGEQPSALDALNYVCSKKGCPKVARMTIPTQRRYVHFFGNMLEGKKPNSPPLMLRRLIMTAVPDMSTAVGEGQDPAQRGCRPYVQVFKNGALLFTSTRKPSDSGAETPFHSESEGAISFQIDAVVQGDILLRCKHLDIESGQTVSMFRAGLHTGFVPSGVLRLSADQLDGPSSDPRFRNDFFVDLIFAPVSTAEHPQHTVGESDVLQEGVKVSPSQEAEYDRLIKEDAEFWDEVEFRKNKRKTLEKMRLEESSQEDVRFSLAEDEEDVHVSPKVERHASEDLKRQLEALSTPVAPPEAVTNSKTEPEEVVKTKTQVQDESSNTDTQDVDTQDRQEDVPPESTKEDPLPIAGEKHVAGSDEYGKETLELEELEKELGLEGISDLDFVAAKTNESLGETPRQVLDAKGEEVKITASDGQSQGLVEPDELDELENYLNAL